MLSCDDAAGRWHRRWHRNIIGAIAECALMGAPAVPPIGVTSALVGDGAITAMFLVFKTGVSSDPAQRVRFPSASATSGFAFSPFARLWKNAAFWHGIWHGSRLIRRSSEASKVIRNRGDYWQVKVYPAHPQQDREQRGERHRTGRVQRTRRPQAERELVADTR
jgi:hypothetical protein